MSSLRRIGRPVAATLTLVAAGLAACNSSNPKNVAQPVCGNDVLEQNQSAGVVEECEVAAQCGDPALYDCIGCQCVRHPVCGDGIRDDSEPCEGDDRGECAPGEVCNEQCECETPSGEGGDGGTGGGGGRGGSAGSAGQSGSANGGSAGKGGAGGSGGSGGSGGCTTSTVSSCVQDPIGFWECGISPNIGMLSEEDIVQITLAAAAAPGTDETLTRPDNVLDCGGPISCAVIAVDAASATPQYLAADSGTISLLSSPPFVGTLNDAHFVRIVVLNDGTVVDAGSDNCYDVPTLELE